MTTDRKQSLKHEYLYDGGPCVSSCAACAEDTLTDDDEVFSAEGQGVGALVDADTLKPCPQCDRKLCQGCVDRADFPDHNTIPEGFEIVPSEEVLPVSRMLANEAIAQEIDAKINEWRHEGAEVERDRILAWLRTYPTTCECKENGGEACRFSDPMNHNGLADAIEKGEHHE